MKITIKHYANLLIAALYLILSAYVNADTTAFNLTLNTTTETELLQKFPNAELIGTSSYSEGKVYSLPINNFDLTGLTDVKAILDEKNILVCITAGISTANNRNRFSEIKKGLDKKYKLVKSKIPFVGDKYAEYKSGDVLIFAEELHMGGFKIGLVYTTTQFHNQKLKADKEQLNNKKQKEEDIL